MLRLLNRFKRDLLSQGKIKSFLFYTVGEVFLVVVGILIALAIDNRATDYKEEQELNEYLIKISENVTSDIKLADSLKNRRLTIKELSKKGLDIITTGEGKTQEFVGESILLFADFEFRSKNSGYESLIASGYISKLSRSKLDSLLFLYYATVDDLMREEQSFNGFIEAMEKSMNAEVSLFSVYKGLLGYEIDPIENKQAIEEYFDVVPFQNAMTRGSFQGAILRRYDALIQTGELLKDEIRTKVNSN